MRYVQWPSRVVVCLAAALSTMCGCAVVGPAGIQGGRGVYTDAIRQTEAEQTLRLIVGLRYAESPTMLAVSSVTANMKLTSNVGADFGIGPSRDYAGNLVPLNAGVAYQENPTISYTPLSGEQYTSQLLSPTPLDLYLLLLDTGHGELVFRMLTERVNGAMNSSETGRTDDSFRRLTELLVSLSKAGCLDWGSSGKKTDQRLPPGTQLQARSLDRGRRTPSFLRRTPAGRRWRSRRAHLPGRLNAWPPGPRDQDTVCVPGHECGGRRHRCSGRTRHERACRAGQGIYRRPAHAGHPFEPASPGCGGDRHRLPWILVLHRRHRPPEPSGLLPSPSPADGPDQRCHATAAHPGAHRAGRRVGRPQGRCRRALREASGQGIIARDRSGPEINRSPTLHQAFVAIFISTKIGLPHS